ncbi:hypothetical protein MUK42_34749 [Musa troglodytarum]|uniref:Uncharacterized protein n=1 Tax=Musa troglodytarum TaxID=320322 RepID=A0A9E7K9F0_9LILI|nr:hypothetical protein MUK42_34749 [Musa troglodytarum]
MHKLYVPRICAADKNRKPPLSTYPINKSFSDSSLGETSHLVASIGGEDCP